MSTLLVTATVIVGFGSATIFVLLLNAAIVARAASYFREAAPIAPVIRLESQRPPATSEIAGVPAWALEDDGAPPDSGLTAA